MEVTKPSEPSRHMCRPGDAASRQAVTRVNVEQASKRPMCPRPCTSMGKAEAAGEHGNGWNRRSHERSDPAGHRGHDEGVPVPEFKRNTGNPKR